MDFETLFKKISPRLKKLALGYNNRVRAFDSDDLYQEMCVALWGKFKHGVPESLNETYIVRGCRFHILNCFRKNRDKLILISLELPINEDGSTLKDVLPDPKEPLDRRIERDLTIEEIKNNGFTLREKQVFSLSLKSYTVREIGKKLGISHVMVVKYKKKIISKWQKKENFRVTE